MDCLHTVMFASVLIIVFSAVQGVPVCEWGKYGHNCDRLCSDQCRLHLVRHLRHCHKDTGKCSEGCVRGRHGDHCDQLCSPNCINTICNHGNGGCTIGCTEGYSGYFCNITTVSAVQGVRVCEWGKYGHNCDRLCSDQCRLHLVRHLRHCQKYTGKCSEGCVRGRHGDHCDQLCSPNCINTICNQGNGGCTIGCTDGYIGYFCNITTGTQIQRTVTTTYRPCDWGRFGEICDQVCPPGCALGSDRNTNYCQTDTGTCTRGCRRGWHGDRCEKLCGRNCIADTCHPGSGHCTHGCRGRYTGEFCEAEKGYNITQSMQLMWMLPVVVLIISTMCCWKRYSSASTPSQADRDLYYASGAGDLEEVKRILSTAGVDINCRVGWWSMTPVVEAAWRGHRDVVELLVSEGADVSLMDEDGDNILHCACWGGDVETVEYVLSLNVVDNDARNKRGETAADVARLEGHHRVSDLLVSAALSDVSVVFV